MPRFSRLSLVALAAASGCATLFGGGTNQTVSFTSEPAAATYTVKASSGMQMAQGKTPSQASLPRSNEYQVDITMPGFQTQSIVLTKGINGWTWVNLVGPTLLGFGIDFISGSAWKLQPALVSVSLQKRADELDNDTYARVRLFDDHKNVIQDRLLKLEPAR